MEIQEKQEIIDKFKEVGYILKLGSPSQEGASKEEDRIAKAPIKSWKNKKSHDKHLLEYMGNLGVIIQGHSNIVVIDVDAEHLIPLFENLAKQTLSVKTRKGLHIYLRTNRKYPKRTIKFLSMPVDILGAGYLVIPPSVVHGFEYDILYDNDVMEVEDVEEIVSNIFFGMVERSGTDIGKGGLDLISFAKEHLGEPQGDYGTYITYNCPLPNHTDDNPSFAVYQHNAICFGCGAWMNASDFMEQALNWPIDRIEDYYKEHDLEAPGLLPPIRGSRIMDQCADFARAIAKKHKTKRLGNGEIYAYNSKSKIYEKTDVGKTLELAQSVCQLHPDGKPEMFNSDHLDNIRKNFNKISEPDEHVIAFKNCLINCENIGKGKITDKLGPDYFTITQIPHNYIGEAIQRQDTLMENTLRSILIDKDNTNTDKYQAFLQFIGYSLIGRGNEQKMLLVTGAGANGKSVLANIIKDLFGKELVSHLSLQQMSARFGLGALVGKRINVIGEIDSDGYVDTSILKAVTSNDVISVEEKGKKHYDARIDAKIIAFGNHVPRVTEGEAYFRRFIHLELKNQFYGEDADKDLLSKLLDDEEGIEWLIATSINEYVGMILSKKGWAYDKSPDEVRISYEWGSDPILASLTALVEESEHSRIRRVDLLRKVRTMIDTYRPGYIETHPDWIADVVKYLCRLSGQTKNSMIRTSDGSTEYKGFIWKEDIEEERRIMEEKFGVALDDF